MSIKLMTEVRQLDLRMSQKLVALFLADNANDEGTHCFPSIRRLAHEAGCSTRTVITIIRELEEIGIVKTLSKGNQYRPTQYYVNPNAGKKLQKFNPSAWATQSECEVTSHPEVNVKSRQVNVKLATSECEAANNITIIEPSLNINTLDNKNSKESPALRLDAFAPAPTVPIPAKKKYLDIDSRTGETIWVWR